jgi:hypothetical protein
MEPTASWVENDFERRPVEHLKDIIDNEFEDFNEMKIQN